MPGRYYKAAFEMYLTKQQKEMLRHRMKGQIKNFNTVLEESTLHKNNDLMISPKIEISQDYCPAERQHSM